VQNHNCAETENISTCIITTSRKRPEIVIYFKKLYRKTLSSHLIMANNNFRIYSKVND